MNKGQTMKETEKQFLEAVEEAKQRLAAGENPKNVFDWRGDFHDGFAAVVLNEKGNYIDHDGNYLSDTWFDFCWDFKDGFARVELNDKYNFIGRNGNYLSDTWFDYCCGFYEGFAAVVLNEKWNFIDHNGNILSDKWFNYCGNFRDGFASVGLNGKYNFINRECNYLSNTWFDNCGNFREGFATVELNNEHYRLRKDGVLCDWNTKEPVTEEEPGHKEMDYKQKYEKAMDVIAKIKKANQGNGELVDFIVFNYPELMENDDERIKNAFIKGLKGDIADGKYSTIYGIKLQDALSWFEKQCEK